jgi:hypothetical protein
MTSDLPGEAGQLDPGLDHLFRTLTAPATPAELAGEHDALAMFRANARPAASLSAASMPTGSMPTASMPAVPGRDAAAPAAPRLPGRLLRFPVRWSVRLAAAAALALGGGAAAAAYAAVLPTPVQHLAHTVLGFAGVPDSHPGNSTPGPGRHRHHTGGGRGGPSPAQALPSTSAKTPSGSSPSAAGASPSPTVSAPAGPLVLSATAASARIPAGSEAVIDGQLTKSGAGVQGVTVLLVERLAGHLTWHVAGTGQTTTAGNVAVSVPALAANAVFRLTIPGRAHSPSVLVTVSPPVAAVLDVGAGGIQDSLVVSVQYAHRADVVVLQVLSPHGTWVYLRSRRLDATGQTTFSVSGTHLKNRVIRVVLLATVRHAAAVSSTVTVPPPG